MNKKHKFKYYVFKNTIMKYKITDKAIQELYLEGAQKYANANNCICIASGMFHTPKIFRAFLITNKFVSDITDFYIESVSDVNPGSISIMECVKLLEKELKLI